MDSALIDFLKKDYPAHFGQEWKEDTMQVRREQRPKGKFEIRDGQLQIVQYTGNGVSVINNNSETDVEIIDFEHYINIFRDTDAGMGPVSYTHLDVYKRQESCPSFKSHLSIMTWTPFSTKSLARLRTQVSWSWLVQLYEINNLIGFSIDTIKLNENKDTNSIEHIKQYEVKLLKNIIINNQTI